MMKRLLPFLLLLLAFSCQSRQEEKVYDVSGVVLGSSYSVHTGDLLTLRFNGGKGPGEEDSIRLVSADYGTRYTLRLQQWASDSFTFRIPEGLTSGDYTLWVIHQGAGHKIGVTHFHLVRDLTPSEGVTIYGQVTCDEKGISGVAVSDGHLVSLTDQDGYYELHSSKAEGYVFISRPSGYDLPLNGACASFFQYLKKGPSEAEQVDFLLSPSDDRSESLLVLGDIHLAGINDDRSHFARSMADMDAYVKAHSDRRFLALTLGDLSWDSYWYSNSFDLRRFLEVLNEKAPSSLPFFHTVGNHDHDQNAVGDIESIRPYKRYVGPTNYSFNAGKYHIVVLDNIECTNPVASMTDDQYRSCRVYAVQEVLDWLRADLAVVPSSTPIIAAMHGNLYKTPSSLTDFERTIENLDELLACFQGRAVHFLTGHTHNMFNIDYLSQSKHPHFEHNCGAVCAAWWQTEKLTGNSLSKDGAPGGYAVLDLDGAYLSWSYKAVGKEDEVQFRSYDLNCVKLFPETYIPSCTEEAYLNEWDKFTADGSSGTTLSFRGNAKNEVLINIWNWDPAWKVRVTENGKSLSVSRIRSYDPLFIVSYLAPRLNKNKASTCQPQWSSHMFHAKASSATSTLVITVTDRFGRVYTEKMVRPKTFAPDAY